MRSADIVRSWLLPWRALLYVLKPIQNNLYLLQTRRTGLGLPGGDNSNEVLAVRKNVVGPDGSRDIRVEAGLGRSQRDAEANAGSCVDAHASEQAGSGNIK